MIEAVGPSRDGVLPEAGSPGGAWMALVVVASGKTCAIPLPCTVETMRPLPIRALRGLVPWVLGVAVVRGEAVPVVDLGMLVGEARAELGRFVRCRVGERTIALGVQRVLGVRTLDDATVRTSALLLERDGPARLMSLGTLDGELLVVLRSVRVLSESEFRAFDAVSAEVSS